MKKWGIIGAIVLILGYSLLVYNDLKGLQNSMIATNDNNQNVYSSILMQMKQSGIIAITQSDKQIEASVKSIEARYGEGGSKSVMNWIQEQNPTIPTELYAKAQQIVEAGYKEFQANQTTLIENKRLYDNKLDKMPSGLFAKLMGFTKEEVKSYTKVLKSETAKADYATGAMSEQNIFGK